MDLLIQNFAKLNQSSRLTRGHDNVNFKPPTCSTFPTAVHVQLTSTWAWSRDSLRPAAPVCPVRGAMFFYDVQPSTQLVRCRCRCRCVVQPAAGELQPACPLSSSKASGHEGRPAGSTPQLVTRRPPLHGVPEGGHAVRRGLVQPQVCGTALQQLHGPPPACWRS